MARLVEMPQPSPPLIEISPLTVPCPYHPILRNGSKPAVSQQCVPLLGTSSVRTAPSLPTCHTQHCSCGAVAHRLFYSPRPLSQRERGEDEPIYSSSVRSRANTL